MDFRIDVDIAAPPETVWSVMADPERWHEWTPSVRSIKLLDKGPLAVGTRAVIRQPKFPPALWTITAIAPGRSFSWRTGGPGAWVYANHAVELASGGTRATLALHYTGILGRLLSRLTRGITERYLGYEAAGLKARSEAQANR